MFDSPPKRPSRVADLIGREIARMLLKEIKDPRIGMVTITGAKVSPDLREARVFFDVHGEKEDKERSLQGLMSARGYIKKNLGKRLRLKVMPNITFTLDHSLEYAHRIEDLIKQTKDNAP